MSDESIFSGILEYLQSEEVQSLSRRVGDLRTRLIRVSLVVFVLFGLALFFCQDVFLILKQPLVQALPAGKEVLNFTGPMEVFMAYMRVSFLIAAFTAAPYLFHQIWKYVAPSLPPATRRMIIPFLLASVTLFVTGACFCYELMMPSALKYLIGLADGIATPVITVDEYVGLVTFMLFGFGIAFELPIILIILERLGLVQERKLAKSRGLVLLGILLMSAFLAPPDVFSQCTMITSMYVMFEATLIIIRWMKRRDAKAMKVAEAAAESAETSEAVEIVTPKE